MEAETITLVEGDIFRWNYRDSGDDRSWGRYHCYSRIAKRIVDMIKWAIGEYFLADQRPTRYFGKRGTWDGAAMDQR